MPTQNKTPLARLAFSFGLASLAFMAAAYQNCGGRTSASSAALLDESAPAAALIYSNAAAAGGGDGYGGDLPIPSGEILGGSCPGERTHVESEDKAAKIYVRYGICPDGNSGLVSAALVPSHGTHPWRIISDCALLSRPERLSDNRFFEVATSAPLAVIDREIYDQQVYPDCQRKTVFLCRHESSDSYFEYLKQEGMPPRVSADIRIGDRSFHSAPLRSIGVRAVQPDLLVDPTIDIPPSFKLLSNGVTPENVGFFSIVYDPSAPEPRPALFQAHAPDGKLVVPTGFTCLGQP